MMKFILRLFYTLIFVFSFIELAYSKTTKINLANKLRKLCEDQIKDETIGIKAGGTGIQALKN